MGATILQTRRRRRLCGEGVKAASCQWVTTLTLMRVLGLSTALPPMLPPSLPQSASHAVLLGG